MGLLFATFAPPGTAPPVADSAPEAGQTSLRWQQVASQAGWNTFATTVGMIDGQYQRNGDKINRLNEICGLIGSIGEQVGLAWAALQDANRWPAESSQGTVDEVLRRMAVRGLCEMSAHFTLGGAHGVANLVLRVLLLDDTAAATINSANELSRGKGFPPGATARQAWMTFSPKARWVNTLVEAASHTSALQVLAAELVRLKGDHRFDALDQRRGMDYHRHRPQSGPQTAAGQPLSTNQTSGTAKIAIAAPHLDPAGDEQKVRAVASEGLAALVETMKRLEQSLPAAIQSMALRMPSFGS